MDMVHKNALAMVRPRPRFSGMRKCASIILIAGMVSTALADVGDVVLVINPQPAAAGNFCSIGLAFDGTALYFDRCSDPLIYGIDPLTGAMVSSFDPGIPEYPNALAFDVKRNGLWIGTQNGLGATGFSCGSIGLPVYFWDFDDNSVTLMFTIPLGLLNPATGGTFSGFCFNDGLAYNENDPNSDADDEIWFSDDINRNVGAFRPDGTLITGYDATTVDATLSTQSGMAIGGDFLYLGNNGGGSVFRADINNNPLTLLDQFVSGEDRQEDMECDPITFAPIQVMWVRTTPQGDPVNDIITAFEIEPDTCGFGGQKPGEGCCFSDGSCQLVSPTDCTDAGGTPKGPGSVCLGIEACCEANGSCSQIDALCCLNNGGTPMGPGSVCQGEQACCFTDGTCAELDATCCVNLGGSEQGPGSTCGGQQACCFSDGSCNVQDAACCVSEGGSPQGPGSTCFGDSNGDGLDDLCVPPPATGACCDDGTGVCVNDVTQADCNGRYGGDGSTCATINPPCLAPPICGDNVVNQASEECDGTDDAACPGLCLSNCTCETEAVPTVSQWGLAVLAMVLLIGAKVYFGRREGVA